MLFKISKRYKKRSVDFKSEKFTLFLRYKNRKNFFFHGHFNSLNEAVARFRTLRFKHPSADMWGELSDDYRVKIINHQYSEKEVDVLTIKQIESRLPELKGFL